MLNFPSAVVPETPAVVDVGILVSDHEKPAADLKMVDNPPHLPKVDNIGLYLTGED